MARPGATNWYDDNAERYSNRMAERPIVKWLAWPGLRSLLPPLADERVLDAGCGDGTYAQRLARRGADVVGVDASEELLERAREQYGDEGEFRYADLRDPLDSFADGCRRRC